MATFDPYRTWLGIPPKEQPPNHYRLLGVGLFETDPDVIANAADRQMSHVRTFQSGKKSAISQHILNELSAARVTLLDPTKRAAYDAQLRQELAAKAAASAPPSAPPSPPPPRMPGSPPPPVAPPSYGATPVQPTTGQQSAAQPTAYQSAAPQEPEQSAATESAGPQIGANGNGGAVRTARASTYAARRRKKSAAPLVLLIAGIALALIILVVVATNIGDDPPPVGHAGNQNVNNGNGTSGTHIGNGGSHQQGTNGHRRPPRRNNGGSGLPDSGLPFPGNPTTSGSTNSNGGLIGIPGLDDGSGLGSPLHVDFGGQVGQIREMEGHTGGASTSAVFTNNGEFILSGGEDNSVKFWNSVNGTERTFDGATEPIRQVDISPDMKHIFAVSGNPNFSTGKLILWDIGTETTTGEIDPGTGAAVTCGEYAPDGESIFIGCTDGTIRQYDAVTQAETKQWQAHRGPIHKISTTNDGNTLISGGQDGQVCVSDVASGSVVSKLTGHAGPVRSVGISSQGGYGISGGDDKTVRYWNLSTEQLQHAFRGHTALVTDVAYSPNQLYAVSADNSGIIKVWDLAAGKEIYEIDNMGVGVRSVAYSYNGDLLTSTASDGKVKLWGLPDFRSSEFRQSHGLDPIAETDPIFGVNPVTDPNLAGGNAEDTSRQPTPSDKTIREVANQLRNNSAFQDDLKPGVQPTPGLINRLLLAGTQRQPDPVYNYVLLEYAHHKAAELGDWASATRALTELETQFEYDPLPKRVSMIESATGKVLSTEQRRQLAPVILDTVDMAIAHDQFDDASSMIETVKPWMPALRDRVITETVNSFESKISSLEDMHSKVAPFFAQLEKNPNDPQANLIVGKYYCRLKGDWERGLPHLAKSGDPQYGKLALTDLSNPASASEAVKLADQWWQLAESLSGDEQANIRNHAASWYEKAEPDLIGVEKDKAVQRIAEAAGSSSTPGVTVDTAIKLPKMDGLSCRFDTNRQTLLDFYGGTPETEKAVADALKWIVDQQKTSDEWNFAMQNGCPDPGTIDAPATATSLALMALLGAGNDLRNGDYRANVQKGIVYLRSKMVPAGPTAACVVDDKPCKLLPTHALATIALCEVCESARDRNTINFARMAVTYINLAQNTDGGWAMDISPESNSQRRLPSDIEATVWFVTALKTARLTGVSIDAGSLAKAENYLKSEVKKAAQSAAAPGIFDALMLLGVDSSDPDMQTYISTLSAGSPSRAGKYLDDYYNTQLMRGLGDKAWPAWNEAIAKDLTSTQSSAGDTSDGSWFAGGVGLNTKAGRLFTTVMATLTLETYYRYPPVK